MAKRQEMVEHPLIPGYPGTPSLPPELAAKVLERVATGDTASTVCRELGIRPNLFNLKCYHHPALRNAHSQAQVAASDALAERVLDIPDEEPDVQRARLKSDNIKWYVAKINPRKYGDSLNVNVTEEVSLRDAMAAARERVGSVIEGQVLESKGNYGDGRTDGRTVRTGESDGLPNGLGPLDRPACLDDLL